MKTIHKYLVPLQDPVTIQMPEGARILSAQVQVCDVCIWAMVDTSKAVEDRNIRIVGTGHPADDIDPSKFIGTVQLRGGSLVLHLFEAIS